MDDSLQKGAFLLSSVIHHLSTYLDKYLNPLPANSTLFYQRALCRDILAMKISFRAKRGYDK